MASYDNRGPTCVGHVVQQPHYATTPTIITNKNQQLFNTSF